MGFPVRVRRTLGRLVRRTLARLGAAGLILVGTLAAAPAAASAPVTITSSVASASSYATKQGFINAVTVLDLRTGQSWQAGSTERLFGAGSIMKVIIATKILATGKMTGDVEQRAFEMITRSDDDEATYLWDAFGTTSILTWVANYYKITDLGTPNTEPGFWGNTHITSHGIAELYYHALRDPAVGPWLSNAMHHYDCQAADGTDQCFGIPQATTGAGVKQSWSAGYGSADNPDDSILHTTGLVDDNRYAVVILTEGVGTAEDSDSTGVVPAAASTLDAMAKILLPGGQIPPPVLTPPSASITATATTPTVAAPTTAVRPPELGTGTIGTLWLLADDASNEHPFVDGWLIGASL